MRAAAPKVLFVINSLAGGGAERVMATLLRNSEEWAGRYEIRLAILDEDSRAFALPGWLKVEQLDCRGRTISSIAGLDRLVGKFDPAITVSFLTRANLATGIAMFRRRRPWIVSERTSTPAHLGSARRQRVTKLMMRLIYPRAARVIAVSAGIAAELSESSGADRKKIDVIANPVDIRAIEEAANAATDLAIDQPYVMALGRLVSVKNFALLIRGFAKADLPCRLVIAGDGPEREPLLRLATDLGIADRLVMPGWLGNPYPALLDARLFALTSNIEGFPNALVEALALGVPAVATNCLSGPAEILARTEAGLVTGITVAEGGILSPVGDVESYAEALRTAFAEPLRARLSVAARARASDYAAAPITREYWNVIERALAGDHGSAVP